MAPDNQLPWDFNPGLEAFLASGFLEVLVELEAFPWDAVPAGMVTLNRRRRGRLPLTEALLAAHLGHLVELAPKLPPLLETLRRNAHLVGLRAWASLAEVLSPTPRPQVELPEITKRRGHPTSTGPISEPDLEPFSQSAEPDLVGV